MEHADMRQEQNFFTEFLHASTEVDIFVVEEEVFVKAVNTKKERARNGKCRAAHPVDVSESGASPEVCACGEKEMVAQEITKRDVSAGAPWLRHLRFDEELHANNTQGIVAMEQCFHFEEIAREKSRIGIQEHENVSSSVFGAAIDGEAEPAVFIER